MDTRGGRDADVVNIKRRNYTESDPLLPSGRARLGGPLRIGCDVDDHLYGGNRRRTFRGNGRRLVTTTRQRSRTASSTADTTSCVEITVLTYSGCARKRLLSCLSTTRGVSADRAGPILVDSISRIIVERRIGICFISICAATGPDRLRTSDPQRSWRAPCPVNPFCGRNLRRRQRIAGEDVPARRLSGRSVPS